MPATDVSVVVPVFRNAATVEQLAARLKRVLGDELREVVFVDDASPDDSWATIERLRARDTCVRGVRLDRNGGQNRAVVAGLEAATGAIRVVMDADLQDPPEAVPSLVAAIRDGADLVYAGRRGRYESFMRSVTSRLFKQLLSVMTRGRVPADAGLFLALRDDVATVVCRRAGDDPYVVVLAAQAASTIRTIPVQRTPSTFTSYTPAMRARVARRALLAALGRR